MGLSLSFSQVSEVKWNKSLSHVQLFGTPWTAQSLEFSRPEYWRGYPFPAPGDLPNPGIQPRSPILQADTLPAEPQGKPMNTGMDSLSLLQSMEFSRPEYWSGQPFLSLGDLPTPGIEPGSPALQADSLPTELWEKPFTSKYPFKYLTSSLQIGWCWERVFFGAYLGFNNLVKKVKCDM